VGTVFYTLSRVTGIPMERRSVAMLPWYVPLLATLVLIVLFPNLSTWLPNVLLGR
jgi:TRAP-type C4-dicarboxylate transport system permease large subunit